MDEYRNYFEFKSTIKNGFPVLVRALILPPDPSVGIPSTYVDELLLFTLKGKPLSFIEPTKEEERELKSEALTLARAAAERDRDEAYCGRDY